MSEMLKRLSPEEQEEVKRRQLAIIKASNQLLRESKEKMLKKEMDPIERKEIENKFDSASRENYRKAANMLHATPEDVESAQFRTVSSGWVEKYNTRLKVRNLSDEELHRKSLVGVTVNVGKKKNDDAEVKPTRRVRIKKRDK